MKFFKASLPTIKSLKFAMQIIALSYSNALFITSHRNFWNFRKQIQIKFLKHNAFFIYCNPDSTIGTSLNSCVLLIMISVTKMLYW